MSTVGVVSIDEVYDVLNLNKGDTTYRTELQRYINGATASFIWLCGPLTATSFTETYPTNGGDRITLRQCPVISIESVVEYVALTQYTLTNQPRGATVDMYGYSLDIPEAGLLVRRGPTGDPMPFLGTEVVISYTAGRPNVPDDVRLAVLEDIRGLWQQTQQIGRASFGAMGATDDVWPTRAPIHLFPRLRAIVDGQITLPGIA